MSSLLKNLIVALGITLILGVIYYATTGGSDESGSDDIFGISDSEISLRTQKILSDTKQIDEYTMDVSIFENEKFRSLVDYHVPIPDVMTGRTNPFAPVE